MAGSRDGNPANGGATAVLDAIPASGRSPAGQGGGTAAPFAAGASAPGASAPDAFAAGAFAVLRLPVVPWAALPRDRTGDVTQGVLDRGKTRYQPVTVLCQPTHRLSQLPGGRLSIEWARRAVGCAWRRGELLRTSITPARENGDDQGGRSRRAP